jgi:hypothetical protein
MLGSAIRLVLMLVHMISGEHAHTRTSLDGNQLICIIDFHVFHSVFVYIE